MVAVGGETVADRQLARFRADPANRGAVCREGLWRYSRHPNYFFEWIHWWAYVAIGLGAPLGGLTILGPVLMLFFMFTLTGIPPTERRAIGSFELVRIPRRRGSAAGASSSWPAPNSSRSVMARSGRSRTVCWSARWPMRVDHAVPTRG